MELAPFPRTTASSIRSRRAATLLDAAQNGQLHIVWSPRTIGPVPEEMPFEESLARRFAARDAGRAKLHSPITAAQPPRPTPRRRCPECAKVHPPGAKPCLKVVDDPGDGAEPEESGQAIGWGAVVFAAAIAIGVLIWTSAEAEKVDQHQAHTECVVVEAGEAVETTC